ncbi:hypothetical protein VKT23_010160 [Stygiomarasmius scandens]|uniref:Uncharacterized protein n=1 Tax=Marasmiellus scandens TaxID=2682957 RepID=A0ABR1JC81_9AGAR
MRFMVMVAHAQVTVVEFGGPDLESAIPELNSAVGVVSASTGVAPIGTADGGSGTTYRYEEVDILSIEIAGSTVMTTVSAEGTLVASASGYKLSFAVPLPSEGGLSDGKEIGIQDCEFIDETTGRCSAAIVLEAQGITTTAAAFTTTGTALTTVLAAASGAADGGGSNNGDPNSGSNSDNGTGGGDDNGGDNDDTNAATTMRSSAMIGTFLSGILFGALIL